MGLMSLKEYGLAYEPSGRDYAYSLYQPVADLNLNAQKQKQVSKSDIDQIEKYADRLFASLNIDVEFTKHFMDRVNDARNKTQITPSELTRLFKQSYRKHGRKIKQLGPDAEAVLNDMQTDINMPFALKVDGNELDLVAKTIMRKKNFKTKGPKLSFEQFRQLDEKKKDTCPPGYRYDTNLNQCVPIKLSRTYFVGVPKSIPTDQQTDTDSSNGNGNGNGNDASGNGNGAGNGGNGGGNGGGESYIAADVRKMPDGKYGVYADKFKNKRRVMTPGGKHAKELKKVYSNKKDANDYMAAIMIAKGG
tara:strand:+ start:3923 stop:4837 length:915 start_codon:yes stop_codon:yes gene_type:complete